MNKKGQGISMTYIIVAALALVVLVIVILFFTGALGTLTTSQKETIEGASSQQLEIWRGQCKLYCTLGQKENWCNHVFKGSLDENKEFFAYICNEGTFKFPDESDLGAKDVKSLDVECEGISTCD